MFKITVQNTECSVNVEYHDQSVTGIRYKLVVTVPKALLSRKRSIMHQIYCKPPVKRSKPKHDLGLWSLDIGNTLSKELGFKYGWNPSVDKGYKKSTTFTFFFNDMIEAERLGFTEDLKIRKYVLDHENRMHIEGYPNSQSPYKR